MRTIELPHLVHPNISQDGLVISILHEGAAFDRLTACENRLVWTVDETKMTLRSLIANPHPRLSAYVRIASGPAVGRWVLTMRVDKTIANIAEGPDLPLFRRVPAGTDMFLETILDHPHLAGIWQS